MGRTAMPCCFADGPDDRLDHWLRFRPVSGVWRARRKFGARLLVFGEQRYLGLFPTREAAERAVLVARQKLAQEIRAARRRTRERT